MKWLFSFNILYISGTSHLCHQFECLHDLYDWKTLGLYLGISYPMLQAIEMDHRRVSDCRMAMLQHWLCNGTADSQVDFAPWVEEDGVTSKHGELCVILCVFY